MWLDFYQNLPLQINPIAFSIGSFAVRWYSLTYIFGFIFIYGLLSWRVSKGEFKNVFSNQKPKVKNRNDSVKFKNVNTDPGIKIQNAKYELRNIILDFLLFEFFAVVLGGRIGYVLLYDPGYFLAHPEYIFSPHDSAGNLVGIFGMSYHGALLLAIVAGFIFVKIKKLSFWGFADFVSPAIAGGYFFGRIGNFLNGELYGRETTSSLGMYFPNSPLTLRYPSQLFEAFLEGIGLFVILWLFRNQQKFKKGSLFAVYIFGYGAVRFFVEFFRQPDFQTGFFFSGLTLGQLLSFPMITVGVLILGLRNWKK